MFNSCNTNSMHKSAVIYRDESASFIYVCYHCGHMFNEISETLRHIESHFQPVSVVLDPPLETVDVKLEVFEERDIDDKLATRNSRAEKEYEKDRCKDLWKGTEILETKESSIDANRESEKSLGKEKPIKLNAEFPYQCHKCSRVYDKITRLKSHLNKHTNDDLLQVNRCKKCDCFYKNVFALRFHVLEKHLTTKRFRCNACAKQFDASQEKQFEKHLEKHNGPEKNLWNDIRDGIYHRKRDFTKFEETQSIADEMLPCEFCTQKFYLKSNLEQHTRKVHSRQPRLQCGQCFAIFTTPKYYYAHQLEHQRVGPIITERDDNVLLANFDALVDERISCNENESGQRSYTCSICSSTFSVHYEIRLHVRTQHVYNMFPRHMETKKEFICDICGMSLKTKSHVKIHLTIHTNSKPYPCSICGKGFRTTGTRRIHERQHTGEKPFQCDQCGKAFISKGLLTAHRKFHDDTTYPCNICGKCFNHPANYRSHIGKHRQDRSFKCTVCSKSFNTQRYLTRHMEIHSDKKFPCNFCGSEFNTSGGRRQHYRHKHSVQSL